jgi:murein L,D-transpeptidase YafK
MKLFKIILSLALFGILTYSFTSSNGPKPKVYRDTVYRFPPKAKINNSSVSAAKPKAAEPVKKKIEVAEEDRIISITSTITSFKVKKSAQKLYAYFADTFKVFRISLGASPVGHKVKEGDNKTPEGTYFISYKNPNSRGYKSLKISYPNEQDRQNAKALNVSPGGDIFIHGLWWAEQDPKNHWKDNWTRGCIAVNNTEIEEIFDHTVANTEIIIQP